MPICDEGNAVGSGIVFNINRYAIHDGPGIRTTVFLKGCPLNCWWCHNPESMSPYPEFSLRLSRCIRCGTCVEKCPHQALSMTDEEIETNPVACKLCFECAEACPAEAREVVGRTMTVEEVMVEIKKDVPFYDESAGGVTFSGGEPLMQPAFLIELLDACGELDLHRVVDTSGHAPKGAMREVAKRTDLFLYDLKHMDPEVHRRYTGVGNELILENLRVLSCGNVPLRVRFPLVPGVNDDRKNVESMAIFLQKLHRVLDLDILPYHDVAISKYKRFGYNNRLGQIAPPSPDHVKNIAALLSSYGLCVTIGGNEYERPSPQAQTIKP
jgi:pyruvate formate lyase activating enzyme